MDLNEKMVLIAEVMDLEENALTAETVLSDLEEWDSIAALTLISMLDEKFGKTVSGQEIKELRRVQDILDYMQ